MVRKYTTQQLLDQIKIQPDFKGFPKKRFIVGIRSKEDLQDKFDDKQYHFEPNLECVKVGAITTNKGNKGTAVMSTGCHYDVYQASDGKKIPHHKHKTGAICLRQIKGIPYRRDYTNDGKTNSTTVTYTDNIGMNYHGATYDFASKIIKVNIGGWSEGCQVTPDPQLMVWIHDFYKNNGPTTYFLLDEFETK